MKTKKLFKDDVELYKVWLTRGIIFYVDGRAISFEKDSIPFTEEIIIRRGYVPVTQNLLFYYHDQCFTYNLTTGKE